MQREYKSKWQKRLNVVFNAAIVVAVLMLSGVLAKKYLLSASNDSTPTTITRGERVSLPETNWQKNTKTLLLFLHSECSYCISSAGFYQHLIKETSNRSDVKLLAVFLNEDERREKYLKDSNISSLENRTANFASSGVGGTPTLVLVDENGVVLDVWNGKLSPEREASVMLALGVQSIKKSENLYVNQDEVKRLVNKKSTVIVDLREREIYDQEHFPDAINIPADELAIRAVNELSPSDTVVVYGDYDGDKKSELAETVLANQEFESVLILRRNGR